MTEKYSFEEAENEAGQIQEGFRRLGIQHPTSEEYERASRRETVLDAQAEREGKERPERIRQLMERVQTLFKGPELAGLRAEIRESFDVPQFGEYHNEGMFMDAHLALMQRRVKEAMAGVFDEAVPEEAREILTRIVREDPTFFETYIFLHDIRKKDCLTVTYFDGEKGSGTWGDWKNSLPSEARENPQAFRAHGKVFGIKGISYFQDRGRDGGVVQHGADAVRHLKTFRTLQIPKGMLVAIREHEVAYQFQGVHPDTYRRHFEHLSPRERELALAATYIDSASSLGKDGTARANLNRFRALVDSKYNFNLIQRVHRALSGRPDVNEVLLERELTRLEKLKKRMGDNPEELIDSLAHECRTR